MVTSKSIFAKALLLCCASLVNQSAVSAQELHPAQESNNDSDLLASIRKETGDTVTTGSAAVNRRAVPDPIPPPSTVDVSLRVGGKRNLLQRAYLDAFKILAVPNQCSDLLGGTSSIAVLNELIGRIGTTTMRRSIAMQMSGPTITYHSHLTGFTFRMFTTANLNLDGLFFRGNGLSQPRVPSIGGFPPNTREARVTVLLHELGHGHRLVHGATVLDSARIGLARVDGMDP